MIYFVLFGILYICYFTKINHHAEELKMFLRFDFTILKLQKDGESEEKKNVKFLKESNCGIDMEVGIYFFNKIFENCFASNERF